MAEQNHLPEISMNSLFSGFPFFDNEFDHEEFMMAILASRMHYAKGTTWEHGEHDSFLLPETAEQILLTHCNNAEIQSTLSFVDKISAPPSDRQYAEIQDAISSIISLQPNWSSLFQTFPLKFYVATQERSVISFSTYVRPQQVFLSADTAFKTGDQLAEQILHETTHVWLYMMEELWRYHNKHDNDDLFSLPSGAPNKTATEILSAAYVVSVLTMLYQNKDSSKWRKRIDYFADYKSKCLIQLKDYAHLTELGRETFLRLKNQ